MTLDQAHLVAVHTLERDEFRREVVAVDGFLGAAARRAGKQPVAAAGFAREGRFQALKWEENIIRMNRSGEI